MTDTNATTEVSSAVENSDVKNSSSPEKLKAQESPEKMTPLEKANRAFIMGKRDLLIRDYPAAVANLSEACQMKAAIHGEFDDELGDVYFYYGKALIANSRSQSGLFGDQLDRDKNGGEAEDNDDSDEGDGEDDENDDGEKEENGDNAEEGEGKDEKSEVSNGNDPDSKKTADSKSEENGNSSEAIPEDSEAAPQAEECEDLQLSWEILEMAKIIYQRNADKDKEIAVKLAEVHLCLGENGLESESYDTAINDFVTCLELQQKNMDDDDRHIAETLYQLGIAYSLSEDFDKAIAQFNSSIDQLEKRLTNLKRLKESGDDPTDAKAKDAFYTVDGEIEEITSAVKEIKDKIVDMEDYKKHLKRELSRHVQASATKSEDGASTSFTDGTAASGSTSEQKPVSNISHLVRKKRKNEDEDTQKPEEKKVKVDSGDAN